MCVFTSLSTVWTLSWNILPQYTTLSIGKSVTASQCNREMREISKKFGHFRQCQKDVYGISFQGNSLNSRN